MEKKVKVKCAKNILPQIVRLWRPRFFERRLHPIFCTHCSQDLASIFLISFIFMYLLYKIKPFHVYVYVYYAKFATLNSEFISAVRPLA